MSVNKKEKSKQDQERFYYGFPVAGMVSIASSSKASAGPQNPTPDDVLSRIFFASPEQWEDERLRGDFQYVVIGSGFCGLAFVDYVLKNDADAKILMLERGTFFLPEHFQNLPPAMKATLPDQKFMNETFPWSLARATATHISSSQGNGFVIDGQTGATWQHGMVPFFGGRSTLWSAWCPRPKSDLGELKNWDPKLTAYLTDDNFTRAEELLNVTPASNLDVKVPVKDKIYHTLQKETETRLKTFVQTKPTQTPAFSINRVEGAPMAVGDSADFRADFRKYSVVGDFLDLVRQFPDRLTIVTETVVERIFQQDDHATGLQTTRGFLPLLDAEVILGIGCVPAATLLLNSRQYAVNPAKAIPGDTFSSHFISAITARVKQEDIVAKPLNKLEMGATYVAGDAAGGLQWHSQVSFVHNSKPSSLSAMSQRYMPDVVSTASDDQLKGSEEHVLIVQAVLGEMESHMGKNDNKNTLRLIDRPLDKDLDPTANCMLKWTLTDKDEATWKGMDEAGFAIVNKCLIKEDAKVEYWDWVQNKWTTDKHSFHVPGMVHEASVLPMGPDPKIHPIDMEFSPDGFKNVFVTGSSLWPANGSWNPTLTMCALAIELAKRRLARVVTSTTAPPPHAPAPSSGAMFSAQEGMPRAMSVRSTPVVRTAYLRHGQAHTPQVLNALMPMSITTTMTTTTTSTQPQKESTSAAKKKDKGRTSGDALEEEKQEKKKPQTRGKVVAEE